MIEFNTLTNANLYIDGASQIGRANEITLPDIVQKMSDYKALGMMAEVELWTGGIEKMSAKIKWQSFFRSTYLKLVNPTQVPKFMARGSLTTHDSNGVQGSVPYICYFNGTPKKIPLGTFKHLDNAEFDSDVSITYIKLEVDGEEIVEIDTLANIYKVNGVDILSKFKIDIGA